MKSSISRERVLRFGVFYIWILTLSVALVVFLLLINWRGLQLNEVQVGFGHLMEIITPQISIMCIFLFRTSKGSRMHLVETDSGAASAAIILSIIYHLFLNACLIFFVLLKKPPSTFEENMNIVLAVAGYCSVIGSAPVAFLFGAETSRTSDPMINNR
jgi:hypothetical protein